MASAYLQTARILLSDPDRFYREAAPARGPKGALVFAMTNGLVLAAMLVAREAAGRGGSASWILAVVAVLSALLLPVLLAAAALLWALALRVSSLLLEEPVPFAPLVEASAYSTLGLLFLGVPLPLVSWMALWTLALQERVLERLTGLPPFLAGLVVAFPAAALALTAGTLAFLFKVF